MAGTLVETAVVTAETAVRRWDDLGLWEGEVMSCGVELLLGVGGGAFGGGGIVGLG